MAAEKKTTEAQATAPEPAVEPAKAEPAKKAAPVKRSKKKPAWVERAHRARGVEE